MSDGDEQGPKYSTKSAIETIILARIEEPSGKVFRRVGAAAFSLWDEDEEMAEMITIIQLSTTDWTSCVIILRASTGHVAKTWWKYLS